MPIPAEWNLSGKAAIITADRRGWTPYLASALAEAGADVAIAGAEDSDMREAADAVEREGRRVLAVVTDVTDSAQAGAAVERALAEFGKIDILVNNARVEFGKPFADVSGDEWKRVMDFNVGSVFVFCQAVGKHMLERGRGRIINMNSGLAVRGLWNSTAACASHGAVHQLTSALALEWARSNIRVCGIGAGWVTTDEPDADAQPDLLDRYLPSRRRGHPTDLCGLLVYLASDADDFITGQTVFIDGGALAHG
jgi:NAD(P)-dependent dehydrogenase (short-subunit alcohol dehydrogenase family)